MRKNEARSIDIGLSHISFHHSPLTEQDVGVVYIVTNDYHSEGRALRDHGVDFKNMSNFLVILLTSTMLRPNKVQHTTNS